MSDIRHFMESVHARMSLSDILSRFISLRRQGHEFKALCPFHNEKTPSFTINNAKSFYHCFGCGAHGNALDFLMHRERLTFKEALESLSSLTGVPAPVRKSVAAEPYKDVLRALALATEFYAQQLKEHAQAKDYLASRDINSDTIHTFGLGYAPREGLYAFLCAKGISPSIIEKAGLCHEDNGRYYDRFRQRLMFPIENLQGKVIAFGGRSLDGKEPKYLNSPETCVFKKREVLYNAHRCMRRDERPLVVVEGYTDVLRVYQSGVARAVAPLGTSVSEQHLQLVWRLASYPIICFDGDSAGVKAAQRVMERALPLLKEGISLSFLPLPQGLDPDAFIQQEGELPVNDAVPLVDYLWMYIRTHYDGNTPEQKSLFESKVFSFVRAIRHDRVRHYYNIEFQKRLRSRDALPIKVMQKAEKIDKAALLLYLVICEPFLLEHVSENVADMYFTYGPLDAVKVSCLDYLHAHKPLNASSLRDYLCEEGFAHELRYMDALARLVPSTWRRDDADAKVMFWQHMWSVVYGQKTMVSHIQDAKEELITHLDEQSWQRYQALKQAEKQE